jgi:alkanesulfonate monooxygenase SsuD/methylene tetrahydromethanopterin reductase-like flavin-dependent oxidoreductase (luciferase family)
MAISDETGGLGPGLQPVLRLNMSGAAATREAESDRYRAAIDLCAYADAYGFAAVNVEEHHDAAVGWLPSPLVMAALIAGRTERIAIRASAILATLYDPIRLAEDIAVIDLASRGRFSFVLGQGYRESEYHMMDRDFAGRGDATDFLIETLLKAWSGEPFEYRGRTVHVSPRPYTDPHPPFWYGGMSVAAAKRAARWGVPFLPGQPMPQIEAIYRAEAERLGKPWKVSRFTDLTLLFIDPAPDRAWAELGPCLIRESQQYSEWSKARVARHYAAESGSIEELRAAGVYEIITPQECLERARRRMAEDGYRPILHPLAGGIPPERAWDCMRLFVEEVMAKL